MTSQNHLDAASSSICRVLHLYISPRRLVGSRRELSILSCIIKDRNDELTRIVIVYIVVGKHGTCPYIYVHTLYIIIYLILMLCFF